MITKFKVGASVLLLSAVVLTIPQSSDAFPTTDLTIQPAQALVTTPLAVRVSCPAQTQDFDLAVRAGTYKVILSKEPFRGIEPYSLNGTWKDLLSSTDILGLDLVATCHAGGAVVATMEERIKFDGESYYDIGAHTVFEPTIPVPTATPAPYDETLIWPINQAPARLYHLSKKSHRHKHRWRDWAFG